MKRINYQLYKTVLFFLSMLSFHMLHAQTPGTKVVNDIQELDSLTEVTADRRLYFNLSDTGEYKPINWGLDLAWLSESNVRRGIAFMGLERVDLIRSSFTPTSALVNGELPTEEMNTLNARLSIINLLKDDVKVVLNCDHPSVDPYFYGQPEHWAELIDVTTRLHQEQGYEVVTVSPFNEPDYSYTGQGTIQDFYDIAGHLRNNSRFDNIRISGGNTLSCDEASPWYTTLKDRLDEGNTHQLAGSFDSYAAFYEQVRANGDHATNDELHNVMEAMVGVEYGLQTGIWWGTAEYARGEFVKASDGRRLAYAEHRPNWTAASVYRHPEGHVQAFVGSSERQAATTSYRFVSMDRDVYYDGYGPQREYIMEVPGGTGYQVGQTNAERMINITWGDDIQPVIDGRYLLVNRNSGMVMEVANGATGAGTNIRQASYTANTYQQWDVSPVDDRIGGDFTYFLIKAVHNGMPPDVYNWSLSNGGNVVVWNETNGANQQWYLEYAEDGWFRIRNRHSAMCLAVSNNSTSSGASVVQWEKNDDLGQQWRLLPVGTAIEFEAPAAPSSLEATSNAGSVLLNWDMNAESDLDSYIILRSESQGGPYSTIARYVVEASYTDNSCTAGQSYFYRVQAEDISQNRSAVSDEVEAASSPEPGLIAHYTFGNTLKDSTVNKNDLLPYGSLSYSAGKIGADALTFNGDDSYLKLPSTIANLQELSITAWIKWNGGAPWQHIFDFGNNVNQSMYLSPRMRFSIFNEGSEQRLEVDELPEGSWAHVAVTLGEAGAKIYVDGEEAGANPDFTSRPIDFKPIFNFIGRSQNLVPLFDGEIDDFKIFNHALSADEVQEVYEPTVENVVSNSKDLAFSVWPVPAGEMIHISVPYYQGDHTLTLRIFDSSGRQVLQKQIENAGYERVDISGLSKGLYMLRISNGELSRTTKIVIGN